MYIFASSIRKNKLNQNKKYGHNNTQAQMRKGVLEFCILATLTNGDAYPTEIIQKMKEAKLVVVEGTLYPLLTRLKNMGLLSYRWEESHWTTTQILQTHSGRKTIPERIGKYGMNL